MALFAPMPGAREGAGLGDVARRGRLGSQLPEIRAAFLLSPGRDLRCKRIWSGYCLKCEGQCAELEIHGSFSAKDPLSSGSLCRHLEVGHS